MLSNGELVDYADVLVSASTERWKLKIIFSVDDKDIISPFHERNFV